MQAPVEPHRRSRERIGPWRRSFQAHGMRISVNMERVERDWSDLITQVLEPVMQQRPRSSRLAAAGFGDKQACSALPGNRTRMKEKEPGVPSLQLEHQILLDRVQEIAATRRRRNGDPAAPLNRKGAVPRNRVLQ